MEINPENKLQDPLSEKTLPLFAQKLKISHFSPTQFALPDGAWLFKYIILNYHLKGIDRVVPIGQALDLDFVWDGYDIYNSLTRAVDIKQ